MKVMIAQRNKAKDLNEFLGKVPHFRAAFEVSNNKRSLQFLQYIREAVDPELDLINIGMKEDEDGNAITWCNICKTTNLGVFLKRYAAEKGILFLKAFTLVYNGNILFNNHLRKTPNKLKMKDGDIITVTMRPEQLPQLMTADAMRKHVAVIKAMGPAALRKTNPEFARMTGEL